MEARDFLDNGKRRMLSLRFPGFRIYDCYSGLLETNFSEMMSLQPDITIGGIVIPELTFRLTRTDMTAHLSEIVSCEVGLEQSREDISDALPPFSALAPDAVVTRTAAGLWFLASGDTLYSVWLDADKTAHLGDSFSCGSAIGAVCASESRVNMDDTGSPRNVLGWIHLLHEEPPYLTSVPFRSAVRSTDGVIHGCEFGIPADDFPDIDGDGIISAADEQLILNAAANIGAGIPTGLTPDQERRADAAQDGKITAADGQLAGEFATQAGAGVYENSPAGWFCFLCGKPAAVTSGLHGQLLRDLAQQHAGISRAELYRNGGYYDSRTGITEIRYARYYASYADSIAGKPGALHIRPVSGMFTVFDFASYGDFLLTETDSQDEDTTEVECCGMLHLLVGLRAADFFTNTYFAVENFAALFANFTMWLRRKGIPIQEAAQDYLNLSALPVVEPDWQTADFSAVTADELLREFALLEGGNALLDRDGLLRLRWCGTDPVLTISPDVLGNLRIGNERLTSATGLDPFYNPVSENVIRTELQQDRMFLSVCTTAEGFSHAVRNVVEHFSDISQIPFDGKLLCGASPLLRAGDTIRAVTRSGTALCVQIMAQDAGQFPFLQSDISAPSGTGWVTQPIDTDALRVKSITADHVPEYVFAGEMPDISGMIVTAFQENGDSFPVDAALYRVTLGAMTGNVLLTVEFAGCTFRTYIQVRYSLQTAGGETLQTSGGERFAVDGHNTDNGYNTGLSGAFLMSQAEYDAAEHDADTKYIVRSGRHVREYLGEILTKG